MKKLFLLPLMLFIISQAYSQKKFSGGLYFAPGISWLSPENAKYATNAGVGFSYKIGGELDINVNDNFAFCFSAQYGQNRASLTFKDSIPVFKTQDGDYQLKSNTKINYKLNYFDIPVFLKFKTSEIGYITYLMKAGGSLSVSLTPRADIEKQDGTTIPDAIVSKSVFPINGGIILGGGIEYNFGAGARLLVELNYNRNLINALRTETINAGTKATPVVRLNVIEMKLGILF